jgi:hypothetical protein
MVRSSSNGKGGWESVLSSHSKTIDCNHRGNVSPGSSVNIVKTNGGTVPISSEVSKGSCNTLSSGVPVNAVKKKTSAPRRNDVLEVSCCKGSSGVLPEIVKKKSTTVRNSEVSGVSSTAIKKDAEVSTRLRRSKTYKSITDVKLSCVERQQSTCTRKSNFLLDRDQTTKNERRVAGEKDFPPASLPRLFQNHGHKSSAVRLSHVDTQLRSGRITEGNVKENAVKVLNQDEPSFPKKANIQSGKQHRSITKGCDDVVVKTVPPRKPYLLQYDSSRDTASSSSSDEGDQEKYRIRRQPSLIVKSSTTSHKNEEKASIHQVPTKNDDTSNDSIDDSDDDSISESSIDLFSLCPESPTKGGILRRSGRFSLSSESFSSSTGHHMSSPFNRSQTRFSSKNEVIEVAKFPTEFFIDMFYDDEELAQFRYEAFCEKIGIDPNFDGSGN